MKTIDSIMTIGEEKFSSNRKMTFVFTLPTTIGSITVPIKLSDTVWEERDKSMVITIQINYKEVDKQVFVFPGHLIGGYQYLNLSFSENFPSDIPSGTFLTLQGSGSGCSVEWGVSTPYLLPAQIIVMGEEFGVVFRNVSYEPFWQLSDNNDGFPHGETPPDETKFEGYSYPRPVNSWKIDANNDGYPWIWGYTEISGENQNIFFKTANGLVPLTAYYKNESGLIPLTFIKQL